MTYQQPIRSKQKKESTAAIAQRFTVDGRVAFVLPAKTGQTSLRGAINSGYETQYNDSASVTKLTDKDLLKFNTVVMTVRHPIARVVSAYYNKWYNKDFTDYISQVIETPDNYANIHIQSMSWLIPKELEVTHMIRVENFQEDYEISRKAVPWLARAVPHANATHKGHKWKTEPFTRGQTIRLKERYAEDFERFNYRWEG